MSETEKVHEKVGEKVAQTIHREAKDATRKALDGVRENLIGKGFRKEDVQPWIRRGAREAAEETR
jgi:hypothetical protein